VIETMALLFQLLGDPAFDGLATWYNGPTGIMRNGEQLRPGGATVAVDDSEWARLQGKHLLILSEDGRYAVLRVTDTGYLYDVGEFYRATPYSDNFINTKEWRATWRESGPAYRIVVDIPEQMFWRLFETYETQRVWAWVIE
jgi:hypothetical protein